MVLLQEILVTSGARWDTPFHRSLRVIFQLKLHCVQREDVKTNYGL